MIFKKEFNKEKYYNIKINRIFINIL